ncbi:MAG: 4-(cytidine 5'-diphospho)-2-C-methyl-D-erythritol kinase [Gammaproteobacteria bacterium]|nr:4-(cytidine 5'-diphospho)-2-C-methyl-D-erythritol kinase [Gammaproteobacteria bacterium]
MDFRYFPAPAKLNLMLHIIGRREDGFHLLQTVFQFLDYCDEIGLRLRADGRVNRVTDIHALPAGDDLVVKAATLFARLIDDFPGVDIDIRKKIPMGGGLGGGSSDAATVLLVLNSLCGRKLSVDQLAGAGLQLGADVPLFIRGHACWAEGVGEKIQPVALPEPWFLVLDPGVHVSTAEVFSHSDLTRSSPLTTIAAFLEGAGRNDCVPVVQKQYPEIASAMQWLDKYSPAKLTGTGACVFAEFATQEQAQQVFEQMPMKYKGFIAKGLNRSPLLDLV